MTTHTERAVRAGQFGTREYFKAVRQDAAPKSKERPVLPAPERTNLEPMPSDVLVPEVVRKMRDAAESAGWVVRLGYSVGCVPHGVTGVAIRHGGRIGVQALHLDSKARVVAVYYLDGRTWEGITLANRTGVVVDATVADAYEFISVQGRAVPIKAWHAERARVRERAAVERKLKRPARTTAPKQREHGG